jgi:DNA-binding CsgD family transcriptional regulator
MSRSVEVLDRIARSDTAVFAFDANDLVILWNRGCEEMLGRSAYQVLGRHCYDIMCGRDIYGNLYCCPNCPVTVQSREHPKDPVQRFELDVATGDGGKRRVALTTFAIPAPRPSLATLVHVLRIPGQNASPLEHELEQAVAAPLEARTPLRTPEGPVAPLTGREQDILRRMARGLATTTIAEQLFISPVTVRNHIARILSKLDVHTKLAAVAFAYRNGLLTPESGLLPTHASEERAAGKPKPPKRASRG